MVPSKIGGKIMYFPVIFSIMGLICIAYAIFMGVRFKDYDEVL
jgi:hypothetical protein